MKETEMYDDQVRGALRTTVERESFEPIDPAPVIRRGRRGLSRRRWLAGSAAGLAVAAVVVGATILPGLAGAGPGQLEPSGRLPGAGAGDAALQRVDEKEMLRRCRMQWSAEAHRDVGAIRTGAVIRWYVERDLHGRDLGPSGPGHAPQFLPGTIQQVYDRAGRRFYCLIPGDSVPTAADIAEDARGGVPGDDASALRRCSTMFWHDLRGWRVLARQAEPELGASIAAMSPSGQYVVRCFVGRPELRREMSPELGGTLMGGTLISSIIGGVQQPPGSIEYYRLEGRRIMEPAFPTCGSKRVPCVGWYYFDTGRMPLNITRLEARTKDGRVTEIPVHDGWFAAAFSSRSTGTLTGFDGAGRRVGSVEFAPVPR